MEKKCWLHLSGQKCLDIKYASFPHNSPTRLELKIPFSYSCSKTRPNSFILHFKLNKDKKRSTYTAMFAAGVTGCNISDSQSWLLYPMVGPKKLLDFYLLSSFPFLVSLFISFSPRYLDGSVGHQHPYLTTYRMCERILGKWCLVF